MIAANRRITFLEAYATLEPHELADGVHPNPVGHRKLQQLVAAELTRLGWDQQGQQS